MKNRKGFAVVEVVLIIVIVGFIGGAGWYVWKNNGAEKTSGTESTYGQSVGVDQNNTQAEAEKTISYDAWTKSDSERDTASAYYKLTDGTANLYVYTNGKPRIHYSSNAPVYCEYSEGGWVHYSAINSQEYAIDNSTTDPCESIESTETEGLTYYSRSGGALGQTLYITALKVNDSWLVFSDYVNYDWESYSEEQSKTDLEKLKQNISEAISKTII